MEVWGFRNYSPAEGIPPADASSIWGSQLLETDSAEPLISIGFSI
jgi:hypothetical protein